MLTPEATIIDDAVRFLRKHHATMFLEDFGPVVLDDLRNGMISELDWSRKHINKQVGRLIRMFTWAAEKELVSRKVRWECLEELDRYDIASCRYATRPNKSVGPPSEPTNSRSPQFRKRLRGNDNTASSAFHDC